MSRRPVVEQGLCRDCLACVEVAPEVFRRHESGFIEVAERDDYPEGLVEEAMILCPGQAIAWADDQA